jgi:hypothetical protein
MDDSKWFFIMFAVVMLAAYGATAVKRYAEAQVEIARIQARCVELPRTPTD